MRITTKEWFTASVESKSTMALAGRRELSREAEAQSTPTMGRMRRYFPADRAVEIVFIWIEW
jgi:hypothetical protein